MDCTAVSRPGRDVAEREKMAVKLLLTHPTYSSLVLPPLGHTLMASQVRARPVSKSLRTTQVDVLHKCKQRPGVHSRDWMILGPSFLH